MSTEAEPKVKASRAVLVAISVLIALAIASVPFLIWSIRGGHRFPGLERVAIGALIGGLMGGLGGAFGVYLGAKDVGKTTASLAGLGAVLAMLSSGPVLRQISRALNPQLVGQEERLLALPEFRAWAAKNKGDLKGAMAQLTARGLRRLDDTTLAIRLGMMAKMLATRDIKRCASIERGTASGADLVALVNELSPEERKSFYETVFNAAVAELRGAPNRRWVSRQARQAFHATLASRLEQEPDGKKIVSTLETTASASDADVCQASRAVYRLAAAMPDDVKKTAALLLLGDDASDHPLLEDGRWLSMPDSALVARAEVLQDLLQSSTETQCAAIARLSASDEDVDRQLEKLPPAARQKWNQVRRQLESAPKGPPRTIDDAAYTQFAIALQRQLGPGQFSSAAYDEPDTVAPGEACRAHRAFVAAVLKLPAPARAVGARVLAGVDTDED